MTARKSRAALIPPGARVDPNAGAHFELGLPNGRMMHSETLPDVACSIYRADRRVSMEAWRGGGANKTVAQQALHQRARLNSAAREGKYTAAMEIG